MGVVFDNLLKETRKALSIPENIPVKYYNIIARKNAIETRNVTVFIAADENGNILELVKKPGPFVRGELLYTEIKPKRSSGKLRSKIKKPVRKLLPCPKGQIRDSVSGRCVTLKMVSRSKSVKSVKKTTKKI